MSGDDGRVSVCLRVRPMLDFEKSSGYNQIVSYPQNKTIVLGNDRAFSFDHVKSETSSQNEVYEECARPLLDKFLEGYNGTIIAYGQTGSGKTYTMGTGGIQNQSIADYGIVPRIVHDMFNHFADNTDTVYEVKVSFLEIYNEEIHDLQQEAVNENGESNAEAVKVAAPVIRESPEGGIYVSGAIEENVQTAEDMLGLLQRGTLNRSVGATLMNTQSSRSHAIFTVHQSMKPKPTEEADTISVLCKSIKCKLNFVDLAGSERLKRTGAQGDRMKEGISINCGLLALGNVISALSENKGKRHIPFRDSKITRLLQDSLGGNSKTVMVACISGADMNEEESLNTMKYASRASTIRNKAVINTDAVGARIHEQTVQNRMYNEHIVVLESLLRSNGVQVPPQLATNLAKTPIIQYNTHSQNTTAAGDRPLPTLISKGMYGDRYSTSMINVPSATFPSMLNSKRNNTLIDSVYGVVASNRLNKTIQAIYGYHDILQKCTKDATNTCDCEGCQLGSKVILKKLLAVSTDEKEEDEDEETSGNNDAEEGTRSVSRNTSIMAPPPIGKVPECGMCSYHKERSELKDAALQESIRVLKLLTRPKKRKEESSSSDSNSNTNNIDNSNNTNDNNAGNTSANTSTNSNSIMTAEEEQEEIDNEIDELMNTSTHQNIDEDTSNRIDNTNMDNSNIDNSNIDNSNTNMDNNDTNNAIDVGTEEEDEPNPTYEQDIENLLCNVGMKNTDGVIVAKTTTTVLMLTQLSQKYHLSDQIDLEENLDVEIVEKQELLHQLYVSREESDMERIKLEEKIVQMRREINATEQEKLSVVRQLETINEKAEAARVNKAYQDRLKSLQTKLRVVERQAKEAETFRTKFLNDEVKIKMLESEVTSAKREKLKVLKELKKKKDEFRTVTTEQKKEQSAMAREKNKQFSLVEKYKKEQHSKKALGGKKKLVSMGYISHMTSTGGANTIAPTTATGYHISTSNSNSSSNNSNSNTISKNHIHMKSFNTSSRDIMGSLRDGVVSGIQVSQIYIEMKQIVRDMKNTEDSLKPLELAYADCNDGDLVQLEMLIDSKQQYLKYCKNQLHDLNDIAYEIILSNGNHNDLVSNELLVKAMHCDVDEPSMNDILQESATEYTKSSQVQQEKKKLDNMIEVLNVSFKGDHTNDEEKHTMDDLFPSKNEYLDAEENDNNIDFAKSESVLNHICFTLKRYNNMWWFQNDMKNIQDSIFSSNNVHFDCIECTKTICKDLLYMILYEWSICKLSASACITSLNTTHAVQEIETAEYTAKMESASDQQQKYKILIHNLREKESTLQSTLERERLNKQNQDKHDRASSVMGYSSSNANNDECPLCGHHKKRYMQDTESTKIRTSQTHRSNINTTSSSHNNNNTNNTNNNTSFQPPTPLSVSAIPGFTIATNTQQSSTPTNVMEAAFHAPKTRHSIHIIPKTNSSTNNTNTVPEPPVHNGRTQRTSSASHSPRNDVIMANFEPPTLVLESDDTLTSLPEGGLFFTPTARGGMLSHNTGISMDHLPNGGMLVSGDMISIPALSVSDEESTITVTEEEPHRAMSPKAMTEGGNEGNRKIIINKNSTDRIRRGSTVDHPASTSSSSSNNVATSVHDRLFTQTTRSSLQRIRSTTVTGSHPSVEKSEKTEFVTSFTANAMHNSGSSTNLISNKKPAQAALKDKKKGVVLPLKKNATPMASAFGIKSLEDLPPPPESNIVPIERSQSTTDIGNIEKPFFAPGMRITITPLMSSSPIDMNNVLVDTDMTEDPPPAPPTLTSSTTYHNPSQEHNQVVL